MRRSNYDKTHILIPVDSDLKMNDRCVHINAAAIQTHKRRASATDADLTMEVVVQQPEPTTPTPPPPPAEPISDTNAVPETIPNRTRLLDVYNELCTEFHARYGRIAELRQLLQLLRQEHSNLIENSKKAPGANDEHCSATEQRRYKLEESVRIVSDEIEHISTGIAEAIFQRNAMPFLNVYHTLQAQIDDHFARHEPVPYVVLEELETLTTKFISVFRNANTNNHAKRLPPSTLRMTRAQKETYRRINHFREYLRQIQGKSRGAVPKAIIDNVTAELKKHRVLLHEAKPRHVRGALKRMRQASYYEHIISITSAINPCYQPLDIPEYRVERLCAYFMKTERPFNQIRARVNKFRKNFLSYPYVMYQLCQLFEWDEYLGELKLLQPELLIPQDRWWRLICEELGWQPLRTVGSLNLFI